MKNVQEKKRRSNKPIRETRAWPAKEKEAAYEDGNHEGIDGEV